MEVAVESGRVREKSRGQQKEASPLREGGRSTHGGDGKALSKITNRTKV